MASPKERGGTKNLENMRKQNEPGSIWWKDWLHKSPYYIIAKSPEFYQLMNL